MNQQAIESSQDTDIIEGEFTKETHLDSTHAMIALNRSELDIAISTAKAYPRSLKQFKQEALEYATMDEETAAAMFYVLPRGGKKIDGPSVRLAEVVGSCWGNLQYGARVVSIDDEFVTAQGMCRDTQRNIAIQYEVMRRITDKYGKRFKEDMIQVTANAACSIALRQAIFKVVPRVFINELFEAAKLASIGKTKTFSQQRDAAMSWFIKAGADESQVLRILNRAGIDDMTTDDIITLRGLATAIKDGETTLEDSLGLNGGSKGSKVGESDLAAATAKATKPNGKKKPAAQQLTPGEIPLDTPDEREPGDESDDAAFEAANGEGLFNKGNESPE